ncbi:MAG TPA: phosphoribosyltransferase family protein [Candidatus Nanoarchaeia archaeon]|nr:phosphoribosyltransferase family protein [Candidatus Nanoarchaeia archaeon]
MSIFKEETIFKDRVDAGQKLSRVLSKYQNKNLLVLGIARGGAIVGKEVARNLNADFDIIIAKKLPYPDDPEAGFGAVAEDGSYVFLPDMSPGKEEVERIKDEQVEEIKRRIAVLRGGRDIKQIEGKVVILVDDGMAMGMTLQAAIKMCRKKKASFVVAAVPVTSFGTSELVRPMVDELIVLEMPAFFIAVAQGYEHWYDVSDEEVIEVLKR